MYHETNINYKINSLAKTNNINHAQQIKLDTETTNGKHNFQLFKLVPYYKVLPPKIIFIAFTRLTNNKLFSIE